MFRSARCGSCGRSLPAVIWGERLSVIGRASKRRCRSVWAAPPRSDRALGEGEDAFALLDMVEGESVGPSRGGLLERGEGGPDVLADFRDRPVIDTALVRDAATPDA
jgi:hypothetical protein